MMLQSKQVVPEKNSLLYLKERLKESERQAEGRGGGKWSGI